MIDLTPIFQAVLALLAALITYKLIPWIKARTTTEQRSMLMAVTSTLVFAAEQLYGAGKGDDKLAYVVTELKERGFEVDIAAIEAIVKDYAEELHKPRLSGTSHRLISIRIEGLIIEVRMGIYQLHRLNFS